MIYQDLRQEIKQKDEIIQELSIRVGRSEEMVKNSVSLIDFKKSQFLLEESKDNLSEELKKSEQARKISQKELQHEKTTNMFLIIALIILLVVASILWFTEI